MKAKKGRRGLFQTATDGGEVASRCSAHDLGYRGNGRRGNLKMDCVLDSNGVGMLKSLILVSLLWL